MKNLWMLPTCIACLAGPARAVDVETEPAPPMFGSRDSVWGALQLQYRARPELRHNADLNNGRSDTLIFGLQRARLGLTLSYAELVDVFVQVQDARMAGAGNSSVAYIGNTDLHQAWVRFNLPSFDLTVKLGRQQLIYGDQRLIGHLEWSNQGRVFEAAVVRWQHQLGWLDGFAAVFTPWPNGNLLDATHFFGLYDSATFMEGKVIWEQYLLGLVDTGNAMPAGAVVAPNVNAQMASPGRQVATLGTRLRYKGNGLDTGLEGAYQLGYASAATTLGQSAFALHADLRYNIDVPLSPFVAIEGNYGSGDSADSTMVSERFINLFPTNHAHYGYMDLQSWSNAIDGALTAGLALRQGVSFRFDYWLHARASADDAWLNAGGTVLARPDPTNPTSHDDELLLGHEFNVSGSWVINPYATLSEGLGLFVPDGYARTVGSDPQLWAFVMLVVSI